jgi:hypothetical protein
MHSGPSLAASARAAAAGAAAAGGGRTSGRPGGRGLGAPRSVWRRILAVSVRSAVKQSVNSKAARMQQRRCIQNRNDISHLTTHPATHDPQMILYGVLVCAATRP